MMYRVRRRGILGLLVILLTAAVIFIEKSEYDRIQRTGDYMENLCFVLGNSRSEQKIFCFTDREEETNYLFLPSYADSGDVKISFAGAQKVIFEREEEKITFKDGEKIGALKYDEKYDMYFCDRLGKELAVEKLVIMHSAGIPAAFLETDSGSMESLDADKDYEETGRIVLFDEDGDVVCVDELERISGRGNSTWAYPKKSYGIRLKNRTDLFGMGSADKWVLLSNVEDRSYIRNKITYDMGVAAGMEGSPESQYIDLYINHKYHGMYQLCEKVEIDPERVAIADLEAENENHNRDKPLEDYGHFETEEKKGIALPGQPRDITGGYLLERDVPEKYREEISGFCTENLGELYTIKEPSCASEAEVDYIGTLVSDMEKAVVSKDGVNPDSGMHYTDYMDLQSFARKYIVEELSKNNGGGATSSFFYKPQDDISKKLFAGPVWDYDKAYANLDGINESTGDLCYLMQRDTSPTLFFWYLNRHPEFRQAVSACYEEFFSDYMQTILDEKIDEYVAQIAVSKDMDLVRWKEIYGESVDYAGEIQKIRNFLSKRSLFLKEVWGGEKEVCTVCFLREDGAVRNYIGVVKGECLERLPGVAPGTQDGDRIFDGWYTEDGLLLDETRPIDADITVYERSHKAPDSSAK